MKKLVFKKGIAVDLTHDNEIYVSIKCGKNTFTLKNYTKQYGHDDSLPYHAILCVNHKELCECLNDGWGGTTSLHGVNKEMITQLNILRDTIGEYKWSYVYGATTQEYPLTMDFIADMLAESFECLKG